VFNSKTIYLEVIVGKSLRGPTPGALVMITRHINRLGHDHDRYNPFWGYSLLDKWR